ncbi:unnamed protein product [Amoebophrya sp. A25]|nr:unnamed protein product [Amoebophrya sp. A25]|eukprot:GSA25T00018125001.1
MFSSAFASEPMLEVRVDEMKGPRLEAATLFCGRLNLTQGVLFITGSHLVFMVSFIVAMSSQHKMRFAGMDIGVQTQLIYGTWFLFGIIIAIGGGVGVLYRIELQLRRYAYYLGLTSLTLALHLFGAVASGELCRANLSPYLRNLTESIMCGTTNTFALFWIVVFLLLTFYCAYIVWSAAEEVHVAFFPELEQHLRRLEAERKKGLAALAAQKGDATLKKKFATKEMSDEAEFQRKMARLQGITDFEQIAKVIDEEEDLEDIPDEDAVTIARLVGEDQTMQV